MRSLRATLPLAVAASLVAVSPAAADAKAPAKAKASGGDAVELIYPSLVAPRIGRTERALERATKKIENGQFDKAATTMKVVRRQLAAAWRGTKYVIRTAPPAPPDEDADAARVRARKSGDAPVGPTYATPPDTAFRVLTLMHDVSSGVVGLIDGSHGAGLAPLSTTLNMVDDRRDQALRYILTVEPPVPPEEDEPEDPADPGADAASVRARASQEEGAVPTFAAVMPNLNPQLDDELQAYAGILSDATDLTAGGRRVLSAGQAQVTRSKAFVATNWPLLPAED
jgi:hypothetical protein